MFEANNQFRQKVVTSAESYVGAPSMIVGVTEFDSTNIELGTTPDPGFNCSGLVLRSICDAIGRRELSEVARPEYRRSVDIVDNLRQQADLPRLIYSDIQPGDVIARTEEYYQPDGGPHLMVATGKLEQGRVPFVHAAREIRYSTGAVTPASVRRGNLKPRPRTDFLRIPLGLLAEKAFKVVDP